MLLILSSAPEQLIALATGVPNGAAVAGKDSDRQRELAERAQEQARRAQERAEERAREAAQRAEERARESAQRAQERAREAAQRAQERTRSNSSKSDDNDQDNARTTDGQRAVTQQTSTSQKSATKTSADEDDKSGSPGKSQKSEKNDKARSSKSSARDDDEDSEPPATLSEFFNRIAKPQPAADNPRAAADTTPAVSVKKVPLPAAQVRIDFPRVPAREMLALNPSAKALDKAANLGFKVSQATPLPGLRMSVTRLLPPDGMSSTEAQSFLDGKVGGALFTPNRTYRPYRAATEGQAPPSRAPVAATTGGGCTAERCFAPQLVGWQPALGSCAKGMKIGVIDTPVDHQHPAFEDVKLKVGTFIGNGQRRAAAVHGTGVVALLAGGPRSGTPGLLPDSEFYIGDIFHIDSDGQPSADTMALLAALSWMETWGVKIVNLSVAGPHDELMKRAIERLSKEGMIFIAAAGNEGPAAPPMYPAAYKEVIAVTAVARDMRPYRHANRGDYIDLAAPGVDIWTAMPGAKESYQSGTSFAVPFATALVATAYADGGGRNKEAILSRLSYTDLGKPGRDAVFGRGLMQAPQACGRTRQPPAIAKGPTHPAPQPVVASQPEPPAAVSSVPPLWAPSVSYGFASSKP